MQDKSTAAKEREGSPESPRDGWDSLLLIGGGLGLLLNLLGAATLAVLAGATVLDGQASEALLPGVQAVAFLAIGVLGLPAIYWGAVGRRNRSVRRPWPAWILALVLFPFAIGLGMLAFGMGVLPGPLGALAHLLAAGSPVLFVASIVLQRGAPISARRRWGHFLAGLWISPPLSILFEVLALIPVGIVLLLGAALNAEMLELLRSLSVGEFNSEAQAMELVSDMMSEPVIVLAAVGYLSLLVPMVEEVLKTLGVWPLLRRSLTTGQAFIGGALCGAGYALFESLFLPQPGEDWLVTMLARTGTPLIHAFNSGLVAVGMVMAFKQRKWIRLPLLYGLAVLLHGSWNYLALGIGLSGYGIEPAAGLAGVVPLDASGLIATIGLFGLAMLSLAGLIWLPARLDRVAA